MRLQVQAVTPVETTLRPPPFSSSPSLALAP